MKINEKHHHDVAAIRPENDLGTRLIDCLMKEANEKNSAFDIPNRCTSVCLKPFSSNLRCCLLSLSVVAVCCRGR